MVLVWHPQEWQIILKLTVGTLWVQHVVAGGDVAPLVGHNAFLRWSAIKDCAFEDSSDGQLKYWSEAHVSEDFDMSVRMQIHNYIGRYIAYTGTGAHLHPPSADMPHAQTLTQYKCLQGSTIATSLCNAHVCQQTSPCGP